jgi:hypothetical protein
LIFTRSPLFLEPDDEASTEGLGDAYEQAERGESGGTLQTGDGGLLGADAVGQLRLAQVLLVAQVEDLLGDVVGKLSLRVGGGWVGLPQRSHNANGILYRSRYGVGRV